MAIVKHLQKSTHDSVWAHKFLQRGLLCFQKMKRVHTKSKDGVPFPQTETGLEFWGVSMNGRDLLLMTAHCCHV